jgi:hypothetical protein
MKTIVIYGERGDKYPQVVTTKESMDAQRDLLLFDIEDPVLFESFEAYSWGHAMAYYKAKYFGEVYTCDNDPDVWKPFENEEVQMKFFSVYRECCELLYFKNKDNAVSYIEEQIEKYKKELTREIWQESYRAISLIWSKTRAQDCQLNIERFAEQLKSLDLGDRKNKGKISRLNSGVQANTKERDILLNFIRTVNDFEFWQTEKINEYREGFVVSEEKFEDEQ